MPKGPHEMKTTNSKLSILFPLLITVLTFYITACQPGSSQTSSIITNPCTPPCWQGIDPGKTTTDEALKLLNTLPDVKKGSIEFITSIEPNDSIKWSWNSKSADYSGRIFTQGEVASLIVIAPKDKTLQFKDVISVLGEPERILTFFETGERVTIAIFILYPTKGYGFLDYYTVSPGYTERIIAVKPEDEVKLIWFGEVKSFYQNLTNGKIGRLPNRFIESGTQIWNGYGQYELLER